jgi:hypothetical protein
VPHKVIYRPEQPTAPDGTRLGWDAANFSGYYKVVQGTTLVVAYDTCYFRTINEVVSDLLDLIAKGLAGPEAGEDFAVWWEGRLLAVYHQHVDDDGKQVALFNDPRNDPVAGREVPTWPGWPTYEEWVAGGKGPLTFDPEAARNFRGPGAGGGPDR